MRNGFRRYSVRSVLGLAASALAGLAGVVASLDGDGDIVPFFIGLTFLGGLEAWASQPPFEGTRRSVAHAAALVWAGAAIWAGVLLLVFMNQFAAQGGPQPPEQLYLGLPATVYHAVGLYGGAVLVAFSAFGPLGPARRE